MTPCVVYSDEYSLVSVPLLGLRMASKSVRTYSSGTLLSALRRRPNDEGISCDVVLVAEPRVMCPEQQRGSLVDRQLQVLAVLVAVEASLRIGKVNPLNVAANQLLALCQPFAG